MAVIRKKISDYKRNKIQEQYRMFWNYKLENVTADKNQHKQAKIYKIKDFYKHSLQQNLALRKFK